MRALDCHRNALTLWYLEIFNHWKPSTHWIRKKSSISKGKVSDDSLKTCLLTSFHFSEALEKAKNEIEGDIEENKEAIAELKKWQTEIKKDKETICEVFHNLWIINK